MSLAGPIAAVLDMAVLLGAPTPPVAADPPEPVAAYVITDGRSIAESLTGRPGNAERGRALYRDAARAGCASCHERRAAAAVAPQGSGPAPGLGDVAERLEPGEIRLWIAAPRAIDPEAAMPGFYAPGQRRNPADPLYAGPRLTAAEIEDLVAYLTAGDDRQ